MCSASTFAMQSNQVEKKLISIYSSKERVKKQMKSPTKRLLMIYDYWIKKNK